MFQSQKDEVGSELFKSDIVTKGKKDCGNISDYRRLRNHDSHQTVDWILYWWKWGTIDWVLYWGGIML